jgi:hypothetical protein
MDKSIEKFNTTEASLYQQFFAHGLVLDPKVVRAEIERRQEVRGAERSKGKGSTAHVPQGSVAKAAQEVPAAPAPVPVPKAPAPPPPATTPVRRERWGDISSSSGEDVEMQKDDRALETASPKEAPPKRSVSPPMKSRGKGKGSAPSTERPTADSGVPATLTTPAAGEEPRASHLEGEIASLMEEIASLDSVTVVKSTLPHRIPAEPVRRRCTTFCWNAVQSDVRDRVQHKYDRYPNDQVAVYYLRVPDGSKAAYLPVGDVFCAYARMDYDASWSKIEGGSKRFWTAYAAAPNLSATDAEGFITSGQRPRFARERYMEAMKHGVSNVALSALNLDVKHLVWMPFGMGAFLRHLPRKLQTMGQMEMKLLRMEIAKCQIDTLLSLLGSDCTLHLCIAARSG